MPISIQWYDDSKRVVLWDFDGAWTLEQLHAIYTESHNMCMTVPENKVIALLDLTHSASVIPPNIFSALSTRRRTQAPNFDMIVVVSSSSLIKVFVNIMMTMPALHDQFALYDTYEDALAFIHQRQSAHERPVS